MEFQSLVKELENTQEFREWHTRCPDAFLAHIFVLQDEANKGMYQLGYYNHATDRITTFIVGRGEVNKIEDQEIAKSPDMEIQPLDIALVKLDTKNIMEAAEKTRKRYHAKSPVLKSFFIIQNLNEEQIYNITYLTNDFQSINVKLDMEKRLLSHDCKTLADFIKKDEPGKS